MNWWHPWIAQGYNVLQLVQERGQQGSEASLLSDEQFSALINYFTGNINIGDLSQVQGDFSTLAPYDEASFAEELAQQQDPNLPEENL